MNIIVFTDSYEQINGVSTIYKTLMQWVERTKLFQLTIIAPSNQTKQIKMNSVIIQLIRPIIGLSPPLYSEFRTGLFTINQISHLVKEDINIVHIATQGPVGILGAFFARRKKLSSIGYYHTDFRRYGAIYGKKIFPFFKIGELLGSMISSLMNQLAYSSCSLMLVQSKEYVNEVKKYVTCPVEVIPTGVDTITFSPPEPMYERKGEFKNKYLGNCKFLAIYVGRIALEKNLSPLIENYKKFEEKGIKIVMIGDGPLTKEIQNTTDIPVTGYLIGDALIDAYRSASLLIFPSLTDTYGMVVIEAMACGIPVICSNVGGPKEIIKSSGGGITCNIKNSDELLNTCLHITQENTWIEYADKARKYAESCSLELSCKELMRYYKRVVSRDVYN